jgi:poly-gamma-glutamate capsule biosynthesis protein CapA/YwtB (metallophosphatase superfamily)
MTLEIALTGDTMLGRGVAETLRSAPPESLFSGEVTTVARSADLFVLNLECCISERGEPWPDPGKPFFFRAPPVAVDVLRHIGVDAVTLANNHALDFGDVALEDTLEHLGGAGIAVAGAGAGLEQARQPALLEAAGVRVAVIGLADHPGDFAAADDRPGIAFAALRRGLAEWVGDVVGSAAAQAEIVLVTPHWGPNMTARPVRHVRGAAEDLVETQATLVAGHSAHVFHGVEVLARSERPLPVLFDLGDFVDDYAVDPHLRNDLGLLWIVTFDDGHAPIRVEAVPLALDYCHTRLAVDDERAWIRDRLTRACREMGTEVTESDGRLVVSLT